uniref:Ig-like domain-containing protein n=1 Tax=Kryptolebias marmoratus TaxID=37003 RepID=A0A3Q3A4N6_KRYMA
MVCCGPDVPSAAGLSMGQRLSIWVLVYFRPPQLHRSGSGSRDAQESNVSVRAGAPLLLHCITSLSGTTTTFFWLAPNSEYVVPPGNNGSLKMFPNGSLEIVAAREEDSGIYLCMAQDQDRNETREVNVSVWEKAPQKRSSCFVFIHRFWFSADPPTVESEPS